MGDPIPANEWQLGAIVVPALPIVVGYSDFGGGGDVPQTHALASLTG
jgi:hypothetical protein